MTKYYIGFDCGTQSTKTALYRDDMVCMAKTQIATNLKCPKPEWLEMDVDDYLDGVIEDNIVIADFAPTPLTPINNSNILNSSFVIKP